MSGQLLQFETFEVRIERKNIKNMYLRIKPSGEVVVSAHPKMDLAIIQDFLVSKESWILKKKQQLRVQNPTLKSDEIRYLGQSVTKRRLAANQMSFGVVEGMLRMELPPRISEERANRLCESWLQEQLESLVMLYLKKYWWYFKQQGIRPVEIKYRQMNSTWGVCRPVRGCITFNKRLIHEKPEFIEYVVLHELCHLIHPNHSAKFYTLVSDLLPNWKAYSNRRA